MKDQKIEAELEKRLTSKGLLRYAWDYFKAFEDLYGKYPKFTDMYEVKYFLLCRTIELAIKAFLREKGYQRKQLLDLGHDLKKLVDALFDNDVIIDIKSIKSTILLSDYYKTKQFEYPQIGYKELPSLEDMQVSTRLLLGMVTNSITREFPKQPNK